MARTLNLDTLQHPSSTVANLTLNDDGSVSGGLPTAGRNRLYNGSYTVWQRGASLSSSGGGVGCDGWREYTDTGGGTQSLDTTGYTAANGTYIPRCYKWTTGASAANFNLFQIIETLNCADLAGRSVTFSAYLACSYSRSITMSVSYSTGTDTTWTGSWTQISAVSESLTSTLTRHSITVTVPSNAKTLQVGFSTAGTNMSAASTLTIANAQLEAGPVATPFEFEDFGTTLRKCQRYYYRAVPGNNSAIFGSGFATGSSGGRAFIPFPVTMRVAPTAIEPTGSAGDYWVYQSGVAYGGQVCSAVPTFSHGGTNGVGIFWSASAQTSGYGNLFMPNSATSYIGVSAEL